LKLESQTFGTVDVCRPVGALVDDDATAFREHLLARATRANGRFIVAMREVPYLDSQALEGLRAALAGAQVHQLGGIHRHQVFRPDDRVHIRQQRLERGAGDIGLRIRVQHQ
jgi:hypothetical protein